MRGSRLPLVRSGHRPKLTFPCDDAQGEPPGAGPLGRKWSSRRTALVVVMVAILVAGGGSIGPTSAQSHATQSFSYLAVQDDPPTPPCGVLALFNGTIANGTNSTLFPIDPPGPVDYPGNFSGDQGWGSFEYSYSPDYGTPGNFPPPNTTQSPPPLDVTVNVTVGQIRTLWALVCQEPAFVSMARWISATNASNLLSNFSIGWRGQYPAGPLLFTFGYSWSFECDLATPAGYGPSYCSATESWVGNLSDPVLSAVSGPFLSEAPSGLGPPPFGPGPLVPSSGPGPLSARLGRFFSGPWGDIVLLAIGAGAVATVVGSVRKRGRTKRVLPAAEEDGAVPVTPRS